MPIGFLVTVAVIAGGTLFALAPERVPRALGRVGYLTTLVVNEIPLWVLLCLLASTTLTITDDDAGSAPAWIGVAAAAATAGGLLTVAHRARSGRKEARAALQQELGPDAAGPADRHLRWLGLVPVPWLIRSPGVRRTANVSYGPAGRRNLLDVYARASRPRPAPAVVYFHGGRFRSGHKNREGRPLLQHLAARGWVCISANYRLAPKAEFPDPHVDAKRVLAWVGDHAEELGIDRDRIVVAGSSAGAHIAALAALTPNDPRLQPGFEGADTRVAAAVCLYGYYGNLSGETSVPSSPADHVKEEAPPFFITHGDADTIVPVAWARAFVEKLRSRSRRPVVYAELTDAQHSFDLFRSIRFAGVVEAIDAFTAATRVGPQPARSASEVSASAG